VEELGNPKRRNKMACPSTLLANLLLPLLPLSPRSLSPYLSLKFEFRFGIDIWLW